MSEAAVKKKVGKDLTEGVIYKQLMQFAIPMIFTNVIQQLYSMVDLMVIGLFVGSVGTVGVSTGGEVSDLMTPVATSVAMAGQIYIAQLAGAKDEKKMKEAIGTMLSLMMLTSVVCMILPIMFYRQILGWLNCPAEAFGQASSYMIITCLGMPFIFGYNAVCAMLRGMGESKRPLIFVSVAAVVNVVLDLIFVVWIPLEAAGTAIATVGSQFGAFAAAFYFMNRHKEHFDFELKLSYFKIKWQHMRVMLLLGIPQLIRQFCVRFSMLWVKANINSYGLVASATYSVGNKIEKFVDVFFNGVTGAGSAMIGQNLGARKLGRVKKTQNITLLYSMIFGALGAAAFLLFPRQLFRCFTSDAAVIEYGVTYLRIMALGCFIHSVVSAYKCMATGAGEAGLSFVIGVLDGVSRIAVCLFTIYVLHMDVTGYFWGAALCHIFPGLVSFAYYASGKWKTKKLLTGE